MNSEPTVVLLAGGKSRRMGKDKAMLNWQGKPMLLVLTERFQAAGFSVVIAGGSVEWAKRLANIPALIVPDLPAHEGFGPLAGIEAGFTHTKAKWLGVVACDLPFAEPRLIAWLAEKLGGYEAVAPVINDVSQPLHAVYSRSCLPHLVAQLESEDKSVKAFLRRINVLYVPEVEWRQVADAKCLTVHLNEPENLKVCQGSEVERDAAKVPALAFVGFSNAGKTSLIERLTKAMSTKGYKVAVIKHHSHMDEQGKDTWRHQRAGAAIVGLVALDGMAMFLPKENMTAEQAVERLLRQEAVDIVLLEGFKDSPFPKIAVLPMNLTSEEAQKSFSELLSQVPDKSSIIAVVTPIRLETDLPQFNHDDLDNLLTFVLKEVMRSHSGFCGER
ncbi:MAG: molybdopterin-guanine dinucleotide biosynthesis protein B [Armatimonadota bacterium]